MDTYTTLVRVLFPFIRIRLRKKYGDAYVGERLAAPAVDGPVDVLVHAASVGEQNLVAPVVRRLANAKRRVLLTAATPTGLARARSLAETLSGVQACYLPFDLPEPTRACFDAARPATLVLVETELWPNLIRTAAAAGTRVVLINGRISDGAYRNYRRFRSIFRPVLASLDRCLVRYEEDGHRFAALGVPEDRIQVAGNLKLAVKAEAEPVTIETDRPVVVFGSTREGEEALILDALGDPIRSGKFLPVFAPRHPERANEVSALLIARGVPVTGTAGRTSFSPAPGSAILVNETGRLMSFYARAGLAFVGGSLVAKGGQNFVEPFLFGKPVVTGPHLDNFRDLLPVLGDALTIVQNPRELAFVVDNFLDNPAAFGALGARGRDIIAGQRQALDRVMEVLL